MILHLHPTFELLLFVPLLLQLAAGAGGTLRSDVEYARAGEVSLKLDAWIPPGQGPFPAAIIVHGGGWEAGDKQTYVEPLFAVLSEAGFAWFSIDYRLAPEHRFPACTNDLETALRWVRKNAGEYKVDSQRLVLLGESAGGHIVSYIGARGRGDTSVAAVVSFYGLHDLLRWEREREEIGRHMRQLLGLNQWNKEAERMLMEASPVNYVHSNMPPYLLIHGTADTGVPVNQSELMCAAMREAGASCELFLVEGAGHGMANWEKEPRFQTYKEKMARWLREAVR